VKLTLLFRASEHGFLVSEFHSLCDEKGATVTLVKAGNGRMAAGYNGGRWGVSRLRNPQGFLASIVDDPEAIGGYSHQKYADNDIGYTRILIGVHTLDFLCISQIDAMRMKDLTHILILFTMGMGKREWIQQVCSVLYVLES
jgi:hypothetical protein